jgi:hypothetical protein
MSKHLLESALILLAVTIGCNEHQLPTAPSPPQTGLPPTVSDEVWIAGGVYDASQKCLDGAEIAVIDGGGAGARTVNVCASGSIGYAYVIKGMHEGAAVTLRVARAGFVTQQRQLTLHGDVDGWVVVNFVLEKE